MMFDPSSAAFRECVMCVMTSDRNQKNKNKNPNVLSLSVAFAFLCVQTILQVRHSFIGLQVRIISLFVLLPLFNHFIIYVYVVLSSFLTVGAMSQFQEIRRKDAANVLQSK